MRGNEKLNNHPIKCYELQGKRERLHWDNFTVVYMDQPESNPGTFACVGLSGHSAATIGRHLGKRVPFSSLPSNLRQTVKDDICGDELVWWSSSSGEIEFQMTREDAASVSQGGKDASDDVAALRRTNAELMRAIDAIKPETLRDELSEYGAWEDDELTDHDVNITRLIWVAGNDITEGRFDTEVDDNE